MTNKPPIEKIEDYPLDSLILYSLREFSNGNKIVADKIHEIFQLKVKDSLQIAQLHSKNGDAYKADVILSNITKAKIAQAEWIYLATQKNKKENTLKTSNKNNIILFKDIYDNLNQPEKKYKKNQYNKLDKSLLDGDFEATRKRAKQLLVIFPDDVNFQKYYGLSQIKTEEYTSAIKTFENALKYNPENPDLLLNMGIAQLKAGLTSHAELFLRKSLLGNNDNLDANRILGKILIKQNNFIEAEYYLKQAYRIEKNRSSIGANLSFCLFKQNKLKKALYFAKLSCKLAPENFRYLNNLGLILKECGLTIESKQAFKKAIEIFPTYSEAHNNLGTLVQKENPSSAVYHYKIAENDHSILSEVYLNTSTAYRQLGKSKLSFKYIKKSIKLSPLNPNSYKILGILFLDKGDFRKAILNFHKTLELNPLEAETYRLLGKLITYDAQSISKLENLLNEKKFEPNTEKHVLFLLGEFYQKIEKYKVSWNYFKQANNLVSKKVKFSIKNEVLKFESIKIIFKKLQEYDFNYENSGASVIFIIGMPRSGTTLIEQIITRNENVFGGGEINIMPQKIDSLINKNLFNYKQVDQFEILNNLRELYLSYLRDKTDKNILTDKMPYNFLYIGILKLMFPESRFIHVSRNPMDNCLSMYKNYFSDNNHSYSYDLKNIIKFYRLYQEYMNYWKQFFPNQIYDLNYENLVSKPSIEINKLISFCNFEWNDCYLEPHKNKREIYTNSASQIRNKINKNSINSWKNYSKFLGNIKNEFELILPQ